MNFWGENPTQTQPQRHYKFHYSRLPQAWEALTCLWTIILVLLCFRHGIMQIAVRRRVGLAYWLVLIQRHRKFALKWVSPVHFLGKWFLEVIRQMKYYISFRHNQLFFLLPAMRTHLFLLQLSSSSGVVGRFAGMWGNRLQMTEKKRLASCWIVSNSRIFLILYQPISSFCNFVCLWG